MNIPPWLQDAGSHERPWWLKTHVEADRAPPGYCRYELPEFRATLGPAEAASPSGARSKTGGKARDTKEGGRSAAQRSHGAKASPSSPAARREAPPTPGQRAPLTPNTHVRQLQASTSRPLKVTPCDEYNRLFWFPPTSLKAPLGTLIDDRTRRGPEAKEGLGQRRKVEGSLDSDYLSACRDVEAGWEEDKLRRARSEPGFGHRPHAVNPSMISKDVTANMVGGATLSLKHTIPKAMQREEKRQVGLYEDSYPMWHKEYKKPDHGLSQSDITQFAGMAVAQKALMRK